MAKVPNRRKRQWIGDLQHNLMAINTIYFTVMLLICVGALMGPLVYEMGIEGSYQMRDQAAAQFTWLNNRMWLPLLFMFLAMGAHSILISHRIAGPLYQLRRVLSAVRDGNLSGRAVLRETDYLRVEEAIINDLIQKTGARIDEIGSHANALRAGLGQLKSAVDAGSTDQARQQIQSLNEHADSLHAVLGHFQTQSDAAPKG